MCSLHSTGTALLAAIGLLATACVPTLPVTPVAPVMPTPTAPAVFPLPTSTKSLPVTSTPAAPTAQKRGGLLRLIMLSDAPHWDPHRSSGPVELWEYLGNYIVNFDPNDGTSVPELAESWEFKDSKTLILHIRKGVRFHDLSPVNGREMTADDIVWNLERINRPSAQYIWRSNLEPVETFKAVDKYTVQIRLKFPFAPILSYLKGTTNPTQPILAHEVEDKLGGEDAYKDLNNARGTGPFMIKSYTPGVGATAARNPQYWVSDRPYLDAVEELFVGDTATLVAAYRTGRVDYGAAVTSAIDVGTKTEMERTNPTIIFNAFADPYVIALVPNLTKPPFNDVRLRKAMFMAIDRQEMLKVNLGDGGHITGPISWKLFPGWTWTEKELLLREGYRPKSSPEGQNDIAQAQKIMRELGYGLDKPLIVSADGSQFAPFINLTPMEVAKSQLQKIGINIQTIKLVDRTQFFDQESRGDFVLRSRGYTAPLEPDAQLFTRHHTGAGRNFQQLSDPDLDKLLDAQRQELDVAKRRQLVLQAQERLWNLYPQVWLHTRDAYFPQQPWVQMRPTAWRRWGDPSTTWVNR